MKATIEIPDELYRRVKAKSALAGLAVREVATTLFYTWVEEKVGPPTARTADKSSPHEVPSWFGGARLYAKRTKHHDMETIRASIARGRAQEAQ